MLQLHTTTVSVLVHPLALRGADGRDCKHAAQLSGTMHIPGPILNGCTESPIRLQQTSRMHNRAESRDVIEVQSKPSGWHTHLRATIMPKASDVLPTLLLVPPITSTFPAMLNSQASPSQMTHQHEMMYN